jgi:hypothetical protein
MEKKLTNSSPFRESVDKHSIYPPERHERLTEQGQQLRARVQEIEQQRRDRAAELRLLEGVEAFGARMRDAMVAPAFEVKQKVLQ